MIKIKAAMSGSSSCIKEDDRMKKKKKCPYLLPRVCGLVYETLNATRKQTRLQYGISDPGVPELVAYRKPVVTFRRTGGLALTGWSARMTTSIKKSLTERYGARLVGPHSRWHWVVGWWVHQPLAANSGYLATS